MGREGREIQEARGHSQLLDALPLEASISDGVLAAEQAQAQVQARTSQPC